VRFANFAVNDPEHDNAFVVMMAAIEHWRIHREFHDYKQPIKLEVIEVVELMRHSEEELALENEAYQEAIARIIKHSHEKRSDLNPKLHGSLREKLDACAFAAAAPENAFTEKALGMIPI
jgi:hypothetical protein